MKVIDNSKYILKEIDKYSEDVLNVVKNDVKEKKATLKTEFDKKLEQEVKLIQKRHEESLEQINKMRLSAIELNESKFMLGKENSLYAQVLEQFKNDFANLTPKNKTSFYKKLAEKLNANKTGKIVKYLTPKGVKITGLKCEDILDEEKIIGVIDEYSEVELELNDVIKEKEFEILSLIKEYVNKI